MQGVAVVTGASAGIGEAIAMRLVDRGGTVVAMQRRPPRVVHERLIHCPLDLSDASAVREAASEIASRYPVRYLVNNAGANRPGPLEKATVEDLDYATAINVRAAMLLAQAFVPAMRDARFGRIVSITSRAIMGKTQRVVYAATKAALVGMTRTLALELAPHGITVNAVAPGPVATDLFDNGHPVGSEKRQRVIDAVPVKRVGTPDDIARAVAFLLDDENGYVTGQTLFVCGGTSVSGTGGE